MAWSTPPTFTAGVMVTEAQMDILTADLAYLKGQAGAVVLEDGLSLSGTSDQTLYFSNTAGTGGYLRRNISTGALTLFSQESIVLTPTNAVFIGDTSNAFMTQGLTLNQGAADDEILAFKSSDVAHGMTAIAETNTWGYFEKASPTDGGAKLVGVTETNNGVLIIGAVTTEDATRSTAAVAPVHLDAYKKSGTGVTALAGNQNLAVIRVGGSTKFIFDSDGDSHQDVGTAWTNFDDFDDAGLLNLLSAHVTRPGDPLRRNFGQWLEESRAPLEAAQIVTFNEDGHHFINWSRAHMLTIGAVRQLADRLALIEAKLV